MTPVPSRRLLACPISEHPDAELPPDAASRFAADLAGIAARRHLTMVVTTADTTFARAVSDRVLTWKPATGELASASGWLEWRAWGIR